MVTCSLLAYAALWDQLAAPSVYKEQEIELGISTASCKSQEERWRHLSSAFEKTKEIQTLILSDSKFWKFSQHKESTVSMYSDFITWLRPNIKLLSTFFVLQLYSYQSLTFIALDSCGLVHSCVVYI